MKIKITMDLEDEYADPNDPMGVTEEAYLEISSSLSSYGDDIQFEKNE
jgi:hypothetical protein